MSESYIEESKLAAAEILQGSLLPAGTWHPAFPPEVKARLMGSSIGGYPARNG